MPDLSGYSLDDLMAYATPLTDKFVEPKMQTQPSHELPRKKVFGGDRNIKTNTFQKYDKNNPVAQEQIGSQPIGILMPNNPYEKEAEKRTLENVYNAVTDPLIAFTGYHGSPKQGMEKILKSGEIKPWKKGSDIEKISAGIETEGGLIWAARQEPYGDFYARGGEASFLKEVEPGAIFKIDIPDSAKLIGRTEPLTAEQITILNEKFIPHYKPLREGDTLLSAESKANGHYGLADFLKAINYDGITYGKDGAQVGYLSDSIKPFEIKKVGGDWEKIID
jgi:hypothetical protein